MIRWKVKPSAAEDEKPMDFDGFDTRLGDLMRGERAKLGKSLLDVQRELKIKAAHVAAIENCDVTAFASPGFVTGYVRSYARYLGIDPEWAYARFCVEANLADGMSVAASDAWPALEQKPKTVDALRNPRTPFIPRGERRFHGIEPSAIGSMAVLLGLIGVIGYGGWMVLQEVQRVQLAPVDEAPSVVAELDPLAGAAIPPQAAGSDIVLPSQDALDRLYRPQALDVPVLVSRDGPIASIDPRGVGGSENATEELLATQMLAEATLAEMVQVVEAAPPELSVFAVRPAWVRVQSADGTILFEKILDAGESYVVPAMEEPPVLRAGNSGSVFFAVNGETYGPSAPGANVARQVVLSPEALSERYELADLDADPELAKYVALAQADTTTP